MPLHINDKTHKGRRMLRELSKAVQRAQEALSAPISGTRAPRKPSRPRPGTLAWAAFYGWDLEMNDAEQVQARQGDRVTGWLDAGPGMTRREIYAPALTAAAAMEEEK